MTPAIVVEATVGSRAASSDLDHPASLPKEVQELRHANAFNPSLYRLMWVAGSAIILSSAASIAAVLACSPVPGGSNSVAPTSSAAPSPIVDMKAHTTTLAPPISHSLEENLKMRTLLDLHRYARNRVLTQGYKITVRFEDRPSRVVQKAAQNLSD
jgi:hypothetical protein